MNNTQRRNGKKTQAARGEAAVAVVPGCKSVQVVGKL
jgi:hypothetical protein